MSESDDQQDGKDELGLIEHVDELMDRCHDDGLVSVRS